MTTLNKKVTRKLPNSSDGHGRNLIVELTPGLTELIRIRDFGRRKWYAVPLLKVRQLGARLEAEDQMRQRKEKRRKK